MKLNDIRTLVKDQTLMRQANHDELAMNLIQRLKFVNNSLSFDMSLDKGKDGTGGEKKAGPKSGGLTPGERKVGSRGKSGGGSRDGALEKSMKELQGETVDLLRPQVGEEEQLDQPRSSGGGKEGDGGLDI